MSRTTALYSRHELLDATIAPFSGWLMPLWYKSGAVKEHLAVIQAAGLFDTSHMDLLFLAGDGSREFLNYAFTRDISDLKPGRTGYGAFLDKRGHCLDDAIVYPFADNRFVVVLNAGMGPGILDHLAALPGADKISIVPPLERLGKIDIQGPLAVELMREILADPDAALANLPYFSFKGDFQLDRSDIRLKNGMPILLSRTGYTGELGFEIFGHLNRIGVVWDKFLRMGRDRGLLPCGLAARDTLRTGAGLPLSHQDIGDWPYINHPWPFALPFADGTSGAFAKDFYGAKALDAATSEHTHAFLGFDPRRVDAHEGRVVVDGREIGVISTIVTDVAIGRHEGKVYSIASPDKPQGWTPRGLACGFVRVRERLPMGAEISLRDGKREIKAVVVDTIRPARSARRKIS